MFMPLFYIIMFTGVLTCIFNKRFENVLPLTFFITIIIIYVFSFASLFGLSCWLLVGISFIFALVALYLHRKKIHELLENMITPGFFLFILLYFFILVLNYKRGLTVWDELSHWGPMVKEILHLNTFYSVDASALLVHKDYPPALQLLESFWCEISGGYKESYLYNSLQIFSLSLFFPIYSIIQSKYSLRNVVFYAASFLLMIMSPLLLVLSEAEFYATIYTDCALGFLLAYSIFSIFMAEVKDVFYYINISLTFSVLLLMKQMGIVFYALSLGMIVCFYIYDCLSFNRDKKMYLLEKIKADVMKMCIAFILIPGFFWSGWKFYIDRLGVTAQFKISDMKILNLIGILKGQAGEPYQHQNYVNFKEALFSRTLVSRPFEMSYWQLIILAILIMLLLSEYGKKYMERTKIYTLTTVMSLGAIGYALAMMLTYVFSFSESEGAIVASYERYMNTYILAYIILALMFFLYIASKKINAKDSTFVLVICGLLSIVVLEPSSIKKLIPVNEYYSSAMEFQKDSDIINSYSDANAKIFIVTKGDIGLIRWKVAYLSLPRKFNMSDFSIGEPGVDDAGCTSNLSIEEWKDELREYDYVYLQNVDKQFLGQYGELFTELKDVENHRLFRIVKKENKEMKLSLVNERNVAEKRDK